jgi:transglutaminase-like putative cysteine protease
MSHGLGSTVFAGLALLSLFAAAPARAAGLTPLYVIPTEDRSSADTASRASRDAALRLELTTSNPERLATLLGTTATQTGATTVSYVAPRQPTRPYDASEASRWLAATLVIDYDEPEVVALRDELARSQAPQPELRSLVEFVDHKLRKVSGEPWQPASLTARRLRGDCTEHAVLTTALARSLGIPARVVMGVVVVQPPGEPAATYGHAWAELRQADHWVIADAALGAAGDQAYYLPLGLLEDEGTGFMVQLLQAQQVWVSRVVVR